MNKTTSLSRLDGTTQLFDNTWLAGLLTRLQAQGQRSVLGSDGVAYVQASPCLLLIDTPNEILLRLYQQYTPSYSATYPFNLTRQLGASSYSTFQAMVASGMPAVAAPPNLAALHMALFTGNSISYLTGSQMVVNSGYFANSPAMIKSVAVSGGMSMADSNRVLTLSVDNIVIQGVLSCVALLIESAAAYRSTTARG